MASVAVASANLASKHVEAIDHMQHGVAVDAVILDVAALRCVDGSAEVALVVENVVELQHHRQRLALAGVFYTPLTPPTNREVEMLVVVGPVIKKNRGERRGEGVLVMLSRDGVWSEARQERQ